MAEIMFRAERRAGNWLHIADDGNPRQVALLTESPMLTVEEKQELVEGLRRG